MKKKILWIAGGVLGVIAAAVAGYVIYMESSYYRIPDNTGLATENNPAQGELETGQDYSIATYNIGFGAYEPEYTFFMDTGEMKDGTKTTGRRARAIGRENVGRNTEGSIDVLKKLDCDFYFTQETDRKSTRSYQVDQAALLKAEMSDYGFVYTDAFHSAYLLYPFTEPHGSVESGLVTLSRYKIAENTRYQFPVSNNFVIKFTDLDRCFTASRIEVSDGKELVLVNLHMSAYDKGGTIRQQQLRRLNEFLSEEADKGNYVIAGGDFNHDIAGTVESFPSEQKIPPWVFELSDEDLPEGLGFVVPENRNDVPSCRGADIPYEKGVTYTVIVDGFIVSDNIKAVSRVIDTGFAYSDHQPVEMTFELLN